MKRKLVKQGNNALTITLPKEWVDHYSLKPGDEIYLKESDADLLIKAKPSDETKKVTADLDDYYPILQKYLQSLYRQGITEIELYYTDQKHMAAAHKILSENLIGYEVVEQSDKRAIIKSVAEVQEGNFDTMFRRVFRINESMLESLNNIINSGKDDEIEAASALENTNNKLTNFCRRSIAKRLYEGQQIILIYSVIEILERMADEIKFTLNYMQKEKTIITQNEKKLAQEALEFFRLCHKSYFSEELHGLVEEGIKRKSLIEESLDIFHKAAQKDFYLMHYLINIIQLTAHILTYRLQIYFINK